MTIELIRPGAHRAAPVPRPLIRRDCGPAGCEVDWLASRRHEAELDVDSFTAYAMENGWGDGLPLVPPTDARVRDFLAKNHRYPDEVIAHSGLSTFAVALQAAGNERDLALLGRELADARGVDTVIPFGTTLRVSGRDRASLDAAVAPLRDRGEFTVAPTATSLEDVFVNLMQGTRNGAQ